MKINRDYLKKIISEEIKKAIKEGIGDTLSKDNYGNIKYTDRASKDLDSTVKYIASQIYENPEIYSFFKKIKNRNDYDESMKITQMLGYNPQNSEHVALVDAAMLHLGDVSQAAYSDFLNKEPPKSMPTAAITPEEPKNQAGYSCLPISAKEKTDLEQLLKTNKKADMLYRKLMTIKNAVLKGEIDPFESSGWSTIYQRFYREHKLKFKEAYLVTLAVYCKNVENWPDGLADAVTSGASLKIK